MVSHVGTGTAKAFIQTVVIHVAFVISQCRRSRSSCPLLQPESRVYWWYGNKRVCDHEQEETSDTGSSWVAPLVLQGCSPRPPMAGGRCHVDLHPYTEC